ncbi:MAG: diguanylate cyclase [Clostridia bacterium]|nr:diguanylate cyclase [Clostridia bacterium]
MNLAGKLISNRYEIKKLIAEGGMSFVWLAEDKVEKTSVAIKILKKGVTSNRVEDIIRFRNESSTVSRLNVPSIARVYEIGEFDDMHYIVMEYINGKSLFNFMQQGMEFSFDEAVEIIYKISEALKYIHHANIIHRDLKPGNIMIDIDSKAGTNRFDIKLVDFGLAQVKELNIKDTCEVIGTLCYMSPEQSGIIKRNVDERSDLYSLGIIFYQLLTACLPFQADCVNSIIHQQIAKVPERLVRLKPDIPVILDKVVLKLLEKEPEKRYQSVTGLISDLEKYRKGLIDFILGLDDKGIKLNYRTNLIGRAEEINKLKQMFNNTLDGKGCVCLIGGEAGRGKTRLVEEFKNYVYENNGIFIDGKCFSGKNKIPYGPFKDALNVYIRQFEKYSDDKKMNIRNQLKHGIGDLGQIVLKLNPYMEEVVGKCPPLVELELERENNRFLVVASQFLYCLGKSEKAIVIMLDDLHWGDEGSFELLNELVKDVSNHPVLIIGTFRDNDIDEGHSLKIFVNKAMEGDYPVFEIPLKAFDEPRMLRFVSSLLFDSEENAKEISNFVLLKSKGNPYFATEILKQLVDEKAIVRRNERWEINESILEKIEISPTIVDILIRKISLLDVKEISILSYAAVIGKKFDIDMLFNLEEYRMEDIVHVIDRAVELQLMERDLIERGKVYFVHDRIKEVFYKNLDPQSKKLLHQKVANVIESMYKQNNEKVVFDLVYHYTEAENTKLALDYAYPAALKAMENYANEEAIRYFLLITRNLEKEGRQGEEKWIECMEYIGQIYITLGRTEEAIELFNKLLPHIKTNLKKANTYRQISDAYFNKTDGENCERFCRLALETVGEKVPTGNLATLFYIGSQILIRILHTGFPFLFVRRVPNLEKEEYKIAVFIYYLLAWTYSVDGKKNTIGTTLKMINFSERKLGNTKELGLSLSVFALFLAEIPWSRLALHYHKKALKLLKKLNDESGLARCYYVIGFYYKCRGEYRRSIECFINGMDIFKRIGDFGQLGTGTSGLAGAYFNLADYENAKIMIEEYYGMCNRTKNSFGRIYSWITNLMICSEKGDFEEAYEYGMKAFRLSCDEDNPYLKCMSGTMLGKLLVERGEDQSGIEYLEMAKELFEKNRFLKEYTSPLFPYLAEAYIEYYEKNKELLTQEVKTSWLKKIGKACKDAVGITDTWINYHCCSLRVSALYYSITENYKKAERLFMESIELAKKTERKFELGMALFSYGKFLNRIGKSGISRGSMESCYNVFQSIGAKVYEKKAGEALGIEEQNSSSMERFTKELRYSQRLNSILTITHDISSILNMDELLEKLMSIVIEVTGAQRGYLMIKDEKTAEIRMRVRKNINVSEIGSDGFSKSIVDEVIKKGEAVLTTNAMEDEKFHEYQSVLFNQLKSVLCIPIKYKEELQGICYLDNPLSSGVFTEEDLAILNSIMTQAAISIENAKLYKLAITDGLTELVIHRHFKQLLKTEVDRAKRYKRVLSLIMFDIDHFKKLNDTYGHQAGDAVLVKVAKITKETFRNVDIIARYGGEEFAVVLPETEILGAQIAAERLRIAIEKSEVVYEGNSLKVTVSVGTATYPQNAADMESLIKEADTALYLSKSSGRNKVSSSSTMKNTANDMY